MVCLAKSTLQTIKQEAIEAEQDSDECERYYLIRKNYLLNMLVFSCCQMRKSFAMLDISVYQFQWALPNKQ